MPMVSVIMPARNAEFTIRDALDSILSQTLHDIEVIVINDSSEDRTYEVLKTYEDCRLRILVNKMRLGQASSRNLGIKIAQGDYLAFVDADDAIHPKYLETLLYHSNCLGPRAILATDNLICVSNRHGSMIPLYSMFVQRKLELRSQIVNRVTLAELISHQIDIKPFINRIALQEAGVLFWERAMGAEWLPFLVELWLNGFKFFVLNYPFYYYRVHRLSSSKQYDTVIRELESVQHLIAAYSRDDETLKALRHYLAFLRARAPWVALKYGRFNEFLHGIITYPPAIGFLILKLHMWMWQRYLTIRSKSCGAWGLQ